MIARGVGIAAAQAALDCVAPAGEKRECVARAQVAVEPWLVDTVLVTAG